MGTWKSVAQDKPRTRPKAIKIERDDITKALERLLRILDWQGACAYEDFDADELINAQEHARTVLARYSIRLRPPNAYSPPERVGKKSEASDWCDGTLLGFSQIR